MSGGVGGCPTRSNKRSRSGSCDKARSETARYRVNHAKISKYTHSYLLCDRSNRANPCRVSFLLSLSFQQQPCETSVENPRFSAKSGPTIRPSPCVWPMNSHPRPPARVSSSSSCSSCSSWPRLRHLLRPQAPLQPQDGPGLAPAMRHGQRGCGEGELLAASVSRQKLRTGLGLQFEKRRLSVFPTQAPGALRGDRTRPDQTGNQDGRTGPDNSNRSAAGSIHPALGLAPPSHPSSQFPTLRVPRASPPSITARMSPNRT